MLYRARELPFKKLSHLAKGVNKRPLADTVGTAAVDPISVDRSRSPESPVQTEAADRAGRSGQSATHSIAVVQSGFGVL